MQLFRAQNTHDGLQAGTIYELDDQDVEYRSGAIEAGFLIEVGPGFPIGAPFRDALAAAAVEIRGSGPDGDEGGGAAAPPPETPAPE